MMIRPKTKRRVLILLIGIGVFSAVAAWLYSYRIMVAEGKVQGDKNEGLAAYKSGDYPTAISKLAEYINHEQKNAHEVDPQALLAFANARSKVPTQNQDYIVLAIKTLRQYCVLMPDDAQARDQLLEMEVPYAAFAPDALARATEILRSSPDDTVALKAVVAIDVRQRKFEDAASAAAHYVDLAPTDLEMQGTNFQIMQALSRSSVEMQAHADALLARYPADPRFKIVKAWAYYYGRSSLETVEQSKQEYKAYHDLIVDAAKSDPPTSQFAKTTIQLLYQMAEYAAADDLLARASAKFNDPQLTRESVQRLFENRKFSEIVSMLGGLDAASPTADANLIAYKALALEHLDKDSEAVALVDELTARGADDRVALGWATVLQAQYGLPAADLKARLAQYQQAQTASPENGYIEFVLGDAYSQMGESDLALQAFRQSCQEMPSWAEPHVRLSELLVATGAGASDEAARAAEEARIAGTGEGGAVDLEVAVAHIKVSYARLAYSDDPSYRANLLNDVKQIQAQIPNEPQTLPIYVAMLSQAGERDLAIDAIQSACKTPIEGGEEVLMDLVEVSRDAKLGMEDTLLAAIERQYGVTPRLAYAKAMLKLEAGQAADGLQLMIDARKGGKTGVDPAYWDRAICQYREISHDPDAAGAWQKLGDAYPNDVDVQSTILTNGGSAWANRDFIRTTIDRLKGLTGDTAVGWKTAEARWLLEDGDEKDAAEAVVLLTSVTSENPGEYMPHVLLASAYDRLKNTASGLEEWHKASQLQPDSPQAQFALLQALHNAGKKDEAVVLFDRLTTMKNIPPDIALAAATIMAAEGDVRRAEKLLVAYPTATNQVLHDATLAKVYRLENRSNDAAAIYLNLAKAKTLDANTIREAADFFGSQHQAGEAKQFLDRLAELTLPAWKSDLIQAGYADVYGSADDAAKFYQGAVAGAGDDPEASILRIGFLIRRQDWSAARAAIDAAAAHWPDNVSIANFSKAETELAGYGKPEELGSLTDAIAADPQSNAALDTIAVATNPASTASQVRAMLDKYPDFEPLYELASRRLMWSGNTVEAISIARQAVGRFAHSVDAARTAAELNAAAGNWNDAVIAAREWRNRVSENPEPVDRFIAAADLATGQSQDAVESLAPYVNDAKAHPDENESLLSTYAQALIRSGRESDAAALLRPLAANSTRWRIVWMDLAPVSYDDGSASENWLELVKPMLIADSIDEQEDLAQAYVGCAERQDYSRDYAAARDVLKPFLDTPKMGALQWLTYAGACGGAADVPAAEQAYRQVLKLDANNAIAQNNLADLLRQNGNPDDLKEAESLVSQTIANHGSDSDAFDYFDTLARVLLKEGRPSDAISAFEKGNQLNPKDLDLLIGLASTCATNNRRDEAVKCLAQIDTLIPQGAHLSAVLQAELETAREVIRKADSQGSVSGADYSPSGK